MARLLQCLLVFLLLTAAAAAADVSGTWMFEVTLDAGTGTPTFEFQQKGEVLTGMYKGMFGEEKVSGTVKGNEIRFTFKASQGGDSVVAKYEGAVQSDGTMKGKADYSGVASGTWTAKKK